MQIILEKAHSFLSKVGECILGTISRRKHTIEVGDKRCMYHIKAVLCNVGIFTTIYADDLAVTTANDQLT
ncbi:hypothetical protein, partial [Lysinibacillus sp. D4B1_S16]|uniref:hypothetical protein n=1 Tax=Lysinibacillus sp. D4B1_S16 TaxID=2941231 RepID=UPI0020BD9CB7